MIDPVGLAGVGGVEPVGPNRGRSHGDAGAVAGNFRDLLMKNLEQVNELQRDASEAVEDLTAGRRDDVESVLVATAKADAAFRMLLTVRNKMMDAYNELQSMRV